MNLLCSLSTGMIVFIIIATTLVISAIIIMVLKNKNRNYDYSYNHKTITNAKVKLVKAYCSPAEMRFIEAVHKSLPKDFIAFPFVSLEKILEPDGSKVDFNIASSKIVDVCIFLQKTMEPVLVIDLYSPSPNNVTLKKIDQDVKALLKKVNLPIIQIKIQDNYDLTILKNDLINSMDEKTFVKIKK